MAKAVDLDEMNVPGNGDDEVSSDGVAVRLHDGVALFWPVTFDRLEPKTRDLAELTMAWVGERRELAKRIDATVPTLRLGGMSWAQIAWCVGMTAEGARQRWGTEDV